MKEYGTDELFGTVKNAPTELSKQQVMEMITILPTLPPPGNSWFNINLNSIIMTTTVVAIISSAVIYFTNPSVTPELPGQEPEKQAITLVETPEETKQTIVQTDTVEPIAGIPIPKISRVDTVKEPAPMPVDATSPFTTIAQEEAAPVEEPNVLLPPAAETTNDPIKTAEVSESPASVNRPAKISSTPSTVSKATITPEKKEDLRLGRLKRTLMRELFEDGITGTRKTFMTVMEFKADQISVNFKSLKKDQSEKYQRILTKYKVAPGPNKRIVLDSDFIMVGNFTSAGFDGAARGKKMKISFKDSTVFFDNMDKNPNNDLFGNITYSPNDKSSNPRSILFPDEGRKYGSQKGILKTGGESHMMLQTEGKVQDVETNTYSASLLTADGSDEDVLFDGGEHVISNAVTMYNRGIDNMPIELSSSGINKLKKELYKNLIQDDQILSNRADVDMVINPNGFIVNGNNPFSPKLQQRYIRVFESYGFSPRQNLKILMSPDFIMVGEFGEQNFSGTVRGKLIKEKIVGSIFEAELGKYSLFGEKDEIKESVTENRAVKSFDRIKVSGLAVIYYSQGPEKDLRLEVAGMPIEDVITEVKNGELRVYTAIGKTFLEESIKVYVSSPMVKSIVVDEAAEFISQTEIKQDLLKVSSFGVGSVELAVNVERLHLVMDGGDIEVEGKAGMERTDFLTDANRGTLEQSGLRVLKNWDPEEKISKSGDNLTALKEALTEKLFDDGFIDSWREEVTISFSTTGLEIENDEVSGNYLVEYLKLLKVYGLTQRNDRKIFLSREFIVIADRNNGKFEFEMRGTNLSFNAQDSWEELEDDVFDRK